MMQMDEEYPQWAEPKQTFKDLFPGDYSGTVAGMPAQSMLPQAPDLTTPKPSGLSQWWGRMNTPVMAGNPNSSPLASSLLALSQVNPYGARVANAVIGQQNDQFQQQATLTNQSLAKQELEQRKQYQDRAALVQGWNLLEQAGKAPAGQARTMVLRNVFTLSERMGNPVPKDLQDALLKSNDEEYAALTAAGQQIAAQNPQLGASGFMQMWQKDPSKALELANIASEIQKRNAEAKAKEAEASAMQQYSKPSSEAPQSPVGGTSPQPGTSGPVQPNVVPGGRGGALSPIQQQIADEAVRQGVDPALALAIAENESSFQFVSGDGGKARGYFQLHEAAAKDASNSLGMRVEDRDNEQGNIKLGVQYIKQVLARAGGNPQGAMALYNWGRPQYTGQGNPRYVQDVTAGHQRYTRLLGGRPASQATADAGPEVTGRIGQLNQEIQALEVEAQRAGQVSMYEWGKRKFDVIHKQIEQKQREVQRLQEAQNPKAVDEYAQAAGELGFPKNPGQRTQEQDFLVNQLVNKRKQEHTAAQGRDATDRTPLKNSHLWLGPDKQRVKGVTTQGQLLAEQERRAKAGEDPLVEWEKLDTEKGLGKEMPERRESIDAAERIQKHLGDPKLAKLVGTLLSNPEANYRKTMAEIFGDESKVPEKYWEVAAELALLTTKVRHQYFGTAQTAQELVNLRPLLGSMGTASAGQLKGQLKTLRNALARVYNAQLQGFDDNYVLAPKSWKPVEIADAGTPGESTPAPKSLTVDRSQLTQQPPAPVSPAVQKALDILNSGSSPQ